MADYHGGMRVLLYIHLSCVLTSLLLFLWRGGMACAGQPLKKPWQRRYVPDLVDSLLFVSGAGMAWQLHLSPLTTQWFAIKLLLLMAYIGVAALVMWETLALPYKRIAFATALLLFFCIVTAASHMGH